MRGKLSRTLLHTGQVLNMPFLTSLGSNGLSGGALLLPYSLFISEASSVDEGTEIIIYLYSESEVSGISVPYTITGIDSGDLFSGSLTGSFTTSHNKVSQIALILSNDRSLEGVETLRIALDEYRGVSASIIVNDTSVAGTQTPGYIIAQILDNPNAYGTSANDYFGQSVAISGNYAIVAANYEDDAGGTSSGKVYIFNVSTGALLHTLDNPNAYGAVASDAFGNQVSISGNYAVVAAVGEDDAGGINSGKVYIFDVTTGALVHTLNNPNAYGTSLLDYFGQSVAISGNYTIVGAKFEDEAVRTNSGKAYIFDVSTGALVHTLNNPNAYGTNDSDQFGESVAISGNYAVVGAIGEGDAGGTSSGKAYIFDVSTGALVHTLNNPNAYGTSFQDGFGYQVSISGNYAVVATQLEDDVGGTSSGKAYIFNVTTGALVHTLDNPNAYGTSLNDNFGYSVAISGNYVVVCAYAEGDAGGASSGKVYIFDVTTGALLHTLDNPSAYGTSDSDLFGRSVAISGNYTIVSASLEDDAGGTNSGKAYIYNLYSANWSLMSQQAKIQASDLQADDQFGYSVAIYGNTAVVGARLEDTGGSNDGSAYIFTRSGTTWTQQQKIQASDRQASDSFGHSVAISGDTVVVGAVYEDTGGAGAGAAYIFTRSGTTWTQQQKIQASDKQANDYFGYSVAISGDTVVVGASWEDTGGQQAGAAYVFTRSGTTWTQQQKIQASDRQASDYFGGSVSIDGDTVVVGAIGEDTGANSAGAAYVFTRSGTTWTQQAKIQASDAQAVDQFGWSVSISGDIVVVGAYEEDTGGTNAGSAYVFTRSGTTWTQQQKIQASDIGAGDGFGQSVSISGDIVVVGAGGEDPSGFTDAGAAYVFARSGTTWTQQRKILASDFDSNDYFGRSVSIYGNTVVVGADHEDTGAADAGAAYIFTAD